MRYSLMKRALIKLAAVAAMAFACAAHALGLGEIEIRSGLNQPLQAVIPISSATPQEVESLTVMLASNEDFERAGMERAEFLSALKFEVQDRVIRVTSNQIAREPFVSFLLDVRWAGGRLLREYTVLLDPPTYPRKPAPVARPATPPVQQPAPTPRAEAPRTEAPRMKAPSADAPATPAEPAPSSRPPAQPAPAFVTPEPRGSQYAGQTYGPVQAKETLWSIAYKLRPDASLTMDQMQVAIFEANPDAFEDGRLTGLMKGTVLRIPSEDEIRSVDPVAAKAQVAQANRGARATPPAVAVTPAPARPPVVQPQPQAPAPAAQAPEEPEEQPAQPAPAEQAPSAEQEAAESAAEPAPAEVPEPAAVAPEEPAPAEPVPDQGQMVDEPAGTPPAEAPMTEPLPATPTPPPAPAEPALLEQILNNPLLMPVAAGLILLILALVVGRKLKDRYAQWQYARASRGAMPTADLRADVVAPMAAAAMPEAETGDDEAATMVRDQTVPAPAEPPLAQTGDRAAFGGQTQAMQTMQDTQAQTQAQTQAHTQAHTQSHEPITAHTGAPKVDFDVSGTYATETVQINLEAGDPVSEAEFHRAYGLYDEAALLLKQALQKDPKRTDARVKLAEIYFEANKANDFVDVARDLKGQLPDAEWQKIALLGSQIAPGNDLFQGAGADAGGAVDLSFDEPAAAAPSPAAESPPAPAAPAADAGLLDFKLEDFKLPETAPAASEPAAASAPAEGGLEFDLESLSLDKPAEAAPETPPAASGGDLSLDSLSLGDFDLKEPEAAGEPTSAFAEPSAPAQSPSMESVDLGGDLSLEEPLAAPGDESSTKLDLARAYMDMGDNDMARSLLNEVQQQGNAQQKKEAQELLQRVAA